LVSWRSREVFSSQTRLQAKSVWDTVIFLLNGIVFILIGLQMPAVVKDLTTPTVIQLVGYGLIISLATIAIRIIWVFAGAYHQAFLKRRLHFQGNEDDSQPVSWKNVLIVAWTGTRGVVSLATALALPLGRDAFPKRHSILLLTFVVILVTLVVQGLTLPLLIRLLNVKPDGSIQKNEEKELQLTLTESILQFIENDFPVELNDNVMEQIKRRYAASLQLLTKKPNKTIKQKQDDVLQVNFFNQMLTAQLEIVKYERELLINFHKEGTFADEVINKAEQELDIEELRLQAMIQKSVG
jgi:monovalent cation/hydrogen antiporter